MIGEVLDGRYRILERLGAGGMGEVFLAEHLTLGRKEALKVLHPVLAGYPQFVQRFKREAQAAGRVRHPNIVNVHHFGQLPDGRFFLAMEYVEGTALHHLLRRDGPLPVARAKRVLAQLARAVGHAHAMGVIHRDLKPENLVLLDQPGEPDVLKVLDFGIAKIVAPDHESQGLTSTGDVFGTPFYMAPELFLGQVADPRADIYAMGCLAFELVVGEPPFLGKTMEVTNAHLTRRADLASVRRPEAGLPGELDLLIDRCLEKDRERRLPSAAAFLQALEAVPDVERVPAPARRSARAAAPSEELATQPTALLSRSAAQTRPVEPAGAREDASLARWGRGGALVPEDAIRLALLDDALAELPPGDGALKARLLAERASACHTPDLDEATGLAKSAVAMTRRLGDDETRLHVLDRAGAALLDRAPPERRLGYHVELAELAEQRGRPGEALTAWLRIAHERFELGQMDEALTAIRAVVERAEPAGPAARYWGPALGATVAIWQGELRAAERALEVAAQRATGAAATLSLLALESWFYRLAERTSAQATLAERAAERLQALPLAPVYRALFTATPLLQAGRTAEALACFSLADAARLCALGDRAALLFLAEWAAAAGDPATAAWVHQRCSAEADRFVSSGLVGTWQGPQRWPLALAALALGRPGEARAHYEAAAMLAESRGGRLLAAYFRQEAAALNLAVWEGETAPARRRKE
jgi:serine/threonine-protein kinase